jgi:hypothetical protein
MSKNMVNTEDAGNTTPARGIQDKQAYTSASTPTLLHPPTHTHTDTQARARRHALPHARARPHTQKYLILIAFNGYSAFVNAPQCNVTRTLPLVSLELQYLLCTRLRERCRRFGVSGSFERDVCLLPVKNFISHSRIRLLQKITFQAILILQTQKVMASHTLQHRVGVWSPYETFWRTKLKVRECQIKMCRHLCIMKMCDFVTTDTLVLLRVRALSFKDKERDEKQIQIFFGITPYRLVNNYRPFQVM